MVESRSSCKVDFNWQKSPVFHFCALSDWDIFLNLTLVTEMSAGSLLWAEGERSNSFICVMSGALEALKRTPDWGKPVIMAQFLPGMSVGELVFDGVSEHSTTLQVVEKASLLILGESQAKTLLQDSPATAAKILRGVAYLQLERLRQANRRLVTLF
ncbi:cyclic nucleotide-binding domain-containing protein [bacterium]|nr:cyclic nucleotide-binding domain-containing protein [bacterium]